MPVCVSIVRQRVLLMYKLKCALKPFMYECPVTEIGDHIFKLYIGPFTQNYK